MSCAWLSLLASIKERDVTGGGHRRLDRGVRGTGHTVAEPVAAGDGLAHVRVAGVALVVVVLVAGVEVPEAGGLLLVRVVADVGVVVARGRAAVAGEDRGVLDDTVVLARQAGAGAEDRLVAAGQPDRLGRRVGIGPHLRSEERRVGKGGSTRGR